MKTRKEHIDSIKKEIWLFEKLLRVAKKDPKRQPTHQAESEIVTKIKVLENYVKFMEHDDIRRKNDAARKND